MEKAINPDVIKYYIDDINGIAEEEDGEIRKREATILTNSMNNYRKRLEEVLEECR